MKTRVISGAVLVALLAVIFVFADVPFVLSSVFGILGAMAVFEVMSVTGYEESKYLRFVSMAVAVIVSFIPALREYCDFSIPSVYVISAVFLFVLLLFISYLLSHNGYRFDHLAVLFMITAIIPVFMASPVFAYYEKGGLLNLILIFCISWGADTGGYMFGRWFGKHKLTPVLSPKKTVEGAIGSLFTSVLFSFVLAVVSGFLVPGLTVNYPVLVAASLLGCAVSVLGDLFASFIKRSYSAKDYSHLIPGHGGIMDRFDSIMFVAPFIFTVVSILPIFNII